MQRLKNVHLENRTIFSHTIKLENFFYIKCRKLRFTSYFQQLVLNSVIKIYSSNQKMFLCNHLNSRCEQYKEKELKNFAKKWHRFFHGLARKDNSK